MTTTITTAQAITTLTAAGHDEADILAAIDSLINASSSDELTYDGDELLLTAGDIEVITDQLNA